MINNSIKNQTDILFKLGINNLNNMQIESGVAIQSHDEVIILSPTGTGKTLAFVLPIIKNLDISIKEIQSLIIVPSRELAIQIEQVIRDMGTGFKVNAVYGGRAGSKDKMNIAHRPAVLIGTPGRVADHLRRKLFYTRSITTLVLDEFDKSLEIGFEKEMSNIIQYLPMLKKKILTSATSSVILPKFLNLRSPFTVNYSQIEKVENIQMKTIISSKEDKIDTLMALLNNIGDQNGIVFFNLKESIHEISKMLFKKSINHSTFYGGMDQLERERALIKFRNSTNNILLSTDLAARGLDIPEINFIIHYQIPLREQDFIHRNGRTARMHNHGVAYVIKYTKEKLPLFIGELPVVKVDKTQNKRSFHWSTLFISGGRKDKISKGDIAGLLFKQGKVIQGDLGLIELKVDCAFVAIKASIVNSVLSRVNNVKLKKKKIRVSLI